MGDEETKDDETESKGDTIKDKVLQIWSENPNLTAPQIAKRAGTTVGYVRDILKKNRGMTRKTSEMPKELMPLDEMDYLRKIITASWGSARAELIVQLFQDHDPNDLKILYNLLERAQCPKNSLELIIYSWAKHRHVPSGAIKEMFKKNKDMLRTFRELGYFIDEEEEEEEESEEEAPEKKSKEEEKVSIEDLLNDLKMQKYKTLKEKYEQLRLKKELKELEKELSKLEESDEETTGAPWGEIEEPIEAAPAPVQTRKVVRPAINPATGEVLRDDKGNIVFETVEEPLTGSNPNYGTDDTMRWILAMQQHNKEDPEKELLKKEIEELKNKMEEEERRKREEEEKRRYEEQIKQLQEQMEGFQKQIMSMIESMKKGDEEKKGKSFEQELLLKLLENKSNVPPEIMKLYEEQKELVKQMAESRPKTDEEKTALLKKIEELEKTLEKKETEKVFDEYKQYLSAMYKEIDNLKKQISNTSSLSDEKYKIDRVIQMDKERFDAAKEIVKDAREGFTEPFMKLAFEQIKNQDMWNKYMMLLQEEERRGLPPGTLINKFFGTPKVTEEEKKQLLEKIDKEIGSGA